MAKEMHLVVDPLGQKHTLYEKDQTTQLQTLNYHKRRFNLSYIPMELLILSTMYVDTNIDDGEIDDHITNKAYQDLGLESNEDYIIRSIKNEFLSNDQMDFYHLFIVQTEKLVDYFEKQVEQVGYINCLPPLPMLFASSYELNHDYSGDVDAYFYTSEQQSLITIYYNGEFLYAKSLPTTLTYLHQMTTSASSETISFNDFVLLLTNNNFYEKNSDKAELIDPIISEIASQISEVINYIQYTYSTPVLTNLYGLSSYGELSIIHPIATNSFHMEHNGTLFSLGIPFHPPVDTISDYLYYYFFYRQNTFFHLDFSIFPAPLPFAKRPSGQLIYATIIATILAASYPLYLLLQIELHQYKSSSLQHEYRQIHQKKLTQENILKEKQSTLQSLKKRLEDVKQQQDANEKLVTTIAKKKETYHKKSHLLITFIAVLNKYSVHVETIAYNQDNEPTLNLHLISSREKSIASAVETFTNELHETYLFSIESITFIEKEKLYKGILKAVIR